LPAADLRSPDDDIAHASRLIAEDPLDAAAHFQRGLAELENGDPAGAVSSLRRALFADPHFGLAAFKLGGAHEALGDLAAARRAYQQALRTLEPHERHEPFLAQIDLADVARGQDTPRRPGSDRPLGTRRAGVHLWSSPRRRGRGFKA